MIKIRKTNPDKIKVGDKVYWRDEKGNVDFDRVYVIETINGSITTLVNYIDLSFEIMHFIKVSDCK